MLLYHDPTPTPPVRQKPRLHLFTAHATLLQTSDGNKEFLVRSAKLGKKQYDFEKIGWILESAISVIAKLRVEWSKLDQVFQQAINVIDICLNKSVKKLAEQVDVR